MAGNKKKNRVLGYFKDVKGELKKVVWPSFKQVKNNTLIVIACVLIIGAFIWILDAIFGLSLGKVVEKWQAPEAVEQTTTAPAEEQQTSETTMTDADYEAYMNSMLEPIGVTYDVETNQYTDTQSGEVLTQEQVEEKLSALEESTTGEAESTTETPAEPTAAE